MTNWNHVKYLADSRTSSYDRRWLISDLSDPQTYGDFLDSLKMPQFVTEDADGNPDLIVPGIYGTHVWPVWGDIKNLPAHDTCMAKQQSLVKVWERFIKPLIGDKMVDSLVKELPVLSKQIREMVDTGEMATCEAVEAWSFLYEMTSDMKKQLRLDVHPMEKSEPPVGWVYIVSTETGNTKIGWTGGYPIDRIGGIETTCPTDLTVDYIIRGTRTLEKSLHREFRSLHSNREWFRSDQSIQDHVSWIRSIQLNNAIRFIEGRDGLHHSYSVLMAVLADESHWVHAEIGRRFKSFTLGDLDGALLPTEKTERLFGAKRNAPCPCGTGKKFKRCCGSQQKVA